MNKMKCVMSYFKLFLPEVKKRKMLLGINEGILNYFSLYKKNYGSKN